MGFGRTSFLCRDLLQWLSQCQCHPQSGHGLGTGRAHRLRAPVLATESWFCVKGCANLCLQTLKKAHFHLCVWMMAGVLWEPPRFRERLERQLASFTSRTVLLLCCFSYRYEVLDPFRNILFFLKTNVLISASEVWGKKPNRNAISVVCLWL